jgi:hypothetical protein
MILGRSLGHRSRSPLLLDLLVSFLLCGPVPWIQPKHFGKNDSALDMHRGPRRPQILCRSAWSDAVAWFGIRLSPTTFAVFDAFADYAGRDAHLSGKVAKALMENAPELLAEPPTIEKADVLADRLLA